MEELYIEKSEIVSKLLLLESPLSRASWKECVSSSFFFSTFLSLFYSYWQFLAPSLNFEKFSTFCTLYTRESASFLDKLMAFFLDNVAKERLETAVAVFPPGPIIRWRMYRYAYSYGHAGRFGPLHNFGGKLRWAAVLFSFFDR